MSVQPNRRCWGTLLALAGAFGVSALVAFPAPVRALDPFACNVKEVAVWPREPVDRRRFHVRCDPSAENGTIPYFAFKLSDDGSSQLLGLATSAVISHRRLAISYVQDESFGCSHTDCRAITVLYLLDQ
jgi:hypothetical protein